MDNKSQPNNNSSTNFNNQPNTNLSTATTTNTQPKEGQKGNQQVTDLAEPHSFAPVLSHNSQQPFSTKKDSLPLDFKLIVGFMLGLAIYNFFAGINSNLNTGGGFFYFLSSFTLIIVLIGLLLRVAAFRNIAIILSVINIVFSSFVIIGMVNIQNKLSRYEVQYNQALQRLKDKGVDIENNKQIQMMNQEIETKKAQSNKLFTVVYIVNSISIGMNILFIVYLSANRIKIYFVETTNA